MCCNLAIRQTKQGKDPARKICSLVDSVVLLRHTLRALPAIADSMRWVECPLLQAIRSNLEHPTLSELLTAVDDVLDEDAQVGLGGFSQTECNVYKAQALLPTRLVP